MNEAMELINKLGIKVKYTEHDKEKELMNWGVQLQESVLDPVHETLAKEVWDSDGKLKSKHKKYILDKLSKWLKEMKIEAEPKHVMIVGSIATYQYSPLSDIDVNVLIDIPEDRYKQIIPLLPNGEPLPGTTYPINYYLSTLAEPNDIAGRQAIYDVVTDKWVKRANKEKIQYPYAYIIEIAKFFMDGIDQRVAEYERDKIELELYTGYLKDEGVDLEEKEIREAIDKKELEVKADLDSIFVALKMVKAFRKKAFEDGFVSSYLIDIKSANSDFSINNLVYKALERFGYIDKLEKYMKIREKYDRKSF